MSGFDKTDTFSDWLKKLTDTHAKARIFERIAMAESGNFGDCDSVGDGVSEMRIHVGPGYRLYFCQTEKDDYLLLLGGSKNTKKLQTQDIKRAKAIKQKELSGD